MRMRIGATVLALLALGACERKAEAPAQKAAPPAATPATPGLVVEGYQHQPGLDLAGFYRPDREIRVDQWRLRLLSVGEVDDFDKWVQGDRSGEFAPVQMVFDDVTSPKDVDELGQTIHANTRRVTPSAWRVSETEIAFVADDPDLGHITFAGTLDPAALGRAKSGGQPGAKVMTGRLTIADVVVDGVGFAWAGGD